MWFVKELEKIQAIEKEGEELRKERERREKEEEDGEGKVKEEVKKDI